MCRRSRGPGRSGAAAGANRFGSDVILQTAGARLADPTRDTVLLDVVRELSIAANVPEPRVYVIADGSQNAFATGRDPAHASLAVTTGLFQRMDREELQGVIGHELGHVRNLDTRYALYVAVLVGLVALVTDSFLRLVVEGWKNGAFVWSGDDDNALAALAMGFLVGIFLLIVAGLLRVVAPLFSALVQASSSREREFLADATSVEFTRNPRALERALTSIAADDDPLEAANRAPSTCGSATRSRPAATGAAASSPRTHRSRPGSIACEPCRALRRSPPTRPPCRPSRADPPDSGSEAPAR